ncbi:MAG: hypothetical protein ACLUUO_20505 [Sellimonas intestinalis]
MTAESKRNEAMIPDIPDEKFRVIGIDENAGRPLPGSESATGRMRGADSRKIRSPWWQRSF